MTISFRPILNKDDQFAQMAGIHWHLFDVPWSATNLAEMFKPNTAYRGNLMLRGDKIIGFIICSLVLEEAEIITIAIDKTFQQQGYGRRLLANEIAELKKLSAKRLFLEVNQHNIAAQKLYDSLGFEPLSIRKKYYKLANDIYADALVLSCNL